MVRCVPALDRPRPVAAVVPCRDEAGSIDPLVRGLLGSVVDRVVVGLDPASRDDTHEIAVRAGATVVVSPRSGYDGPCLAAVDRLRADGFDGDVLFLDAGSKYVLESIGALVDARASDGALTFGIRDHQTFWHQRLGNWAYRMALLARYRHWARDISSVRVVPIEVLDALRLQDRAFSLPFQTIVHALELGLDIDYVPIRCTAARIGASKVSGSPRNSLRAAVQMARSLMSVPDLRAAGRHADARPSRASAVRRTEARSGAVAKEATPSAKPISEV